MPKSAVIRKVPRGERRRSELIDVAEKMFLELGFADTTMQMIAERAGASKETLYAWFQNKETLFNTLVAQRLATMTRRSEIAAGEDASPAHLLPIIAESHG